ncbi:MAG TPA: dihydrodipicolinate reductase [Anaeromyxobacteraceae bacterium]|nr:dihydrodipicolinate reductase [Anaeromyxobacteraceae bacterium]
MPVVVMGLGDIGRAIARAALASPDLEVVAAVDPAHAGRSLEELIGAPCPGVAVTADLSRPAARGGVVLHATGSRFDEVATEVEEAVHLGLSVVSTCEELAYPWLANEPRSDALDQLASGRGVVVLGTGVNPGFVLDRLPAFLSQVTGPVRRVRAARVVDVARRRPALARKAGVGLTEEAFAELAEKGEIGHVGLSESAVLVALGCRIEFDDVADEEIEAVIAEEDVEGGPQRGQVAGLRQVARLFAEGREVVVLELDLHAGADPRDEVEIDADPPLRVLVPGGVPGDLATANAVVHAARVVGSLAPGLATVLDLPSGR